MSESINCEKEPNMENIPEIKQENIVKDEQDYVLDHGNSEKYYSGLSTTDTVYINIYNDLNPVQTTKMEASTQNLSEVTTLRCLCCLLKIQTLIEYQTHLITFHKMDSEFAIKFVSKRIGVQQVIDSTGAFMCKNCGISLSQNHGWNVIQTTNMSESINCEKEPNLDNIVEIKQEHIVKDEQDYVLDHGNSEKSSFELLHFKTYEPENTSASANNGAISDFNMFKTPSEIKSEQQDATLKALQLFQDVANQEPDFEKGPPEKPILKSLLSEDSIRTEHLTVEIKPGFSGKIARSMNSSEAINYTLTNPDESTILEKDGLKYRSLVMPCFVPGSTQQPQFARVYACVLCSKSTKLWPELKAHMKICQSQSGNAIDDFPDSSAMKRPSNELPTITKTNVGGLLSILKSKNISELSKIKVDNKPGYAIVQIPMQKGSNNNPAAGRLSQSQSLGSNTEMVKANEQSVPKNMEEKVEKPGHQAINNSESSSDNSVQINENYIYENYEKDGVKYLRKRYINESHVYERDGLKHFGKMFNNTPYFCCIKCPAGFQTWEKFKIHSNNCKAIPNNYVSGQDSIDIRQKKPKLNPT